MFTIVSYYLCESVTKIFTSFKGHIDGKCFIQKKVIPDITTIIKVFSWRRELTTGCETLNTIFFF